MTKWLIVLSLLLAMPVSAQEGGDPGTAEPDGDDEDPVDPWADFEVGGTADGAYLPLSLGRDRTGLGLRLRGNFGWDSNVFKEERGLDNAFLLDGMGLAYVGANLGLVSLGARAQIAGRLYFGEPDADEWDLKLGGFVKVPYTGGWGFGISGDVLYQQLQTYEITGPITRQDDLRASGAIARAHVGYQFSFIILELGLTGETTDFSEEKDIPSLDSWTTGVDFGVYFDIFGFLQLHPYVSAEYEWFRDQYDRQDDGTRLEDDDLLQLLKIDYGADFKLDLGFLEAAGRAYSTRQEDGAAGFHRYWEYGVRGAADFNMINQIRLTVGGHIWTREYDDRIDIDDVDGPDDQKTVHERYFRGWVELAWNFWEFFYVGGRYTYERRISDIGGAGYAAHEVMGFLEVAW